MGLGLGRTSEGELFMCGIYIGVESHYCIWAIVVTANWWEDQFEGKRTWNVILGMYVLDLQTTVCEVLIVSGLGLHLCLGQGFRCRAE